MRESIPCAKKDLGGFVDYLLPSKLSLPLVFITMQVRFGPTVCIRYNLLIQKVFCILASFRKLQKGYFPRKICVLIGPLFSVKESPLIYVFCQLLILGIGSLIAMSLETLPDH